jgi:hypothetical protein
LVGCNQKNQTNSATLSLTLGDNVIYPENEPPSIQIKRGDAVEVISSVDEYPSQPEISFDKLKMSYIAPFEFEMAGNVWLYNSSNGENQKIITKDEFGTDKSVKKVQWLDNEQLLVLVGNRVGTVSTNRELYLFDLLSNKSRSVLEVDENQNIQKITINEKDVVLNIATYNDDLSDHTTKDVIYNIVKLLSEYVNEKEPLS